MQVLEHPHDVRNYGELEYSYEVHMLDVQTTFLNAEVEAFVEMGPGYEINNEAGVSFIIKLKKSLYGLQQSLKNWFGSMDVACRHRLPPAQVGSVCVHPRGRDWLRHPDALIG